MTRAWLVLAALFVSSHAASAQDPSPMLIRDINTSGASSFPRELTVSGNRLFFVAADGVHSRGRCTGLRCKVGRGELFLSDGTTGGTLLLKDIFPGLATADVTEITDAGSVVFFVANDGKTGSELWKSDGTEAGTTLVADLYPGTATSGLPFSSRPSGLAAVGGVVYFSADDGVHGRELWRSDGTGAGTYMVKDISPGTDHSSPMNFTEIGGALLFSATTPSVGTELWQTDGTAGGTVLVLDIRPGILSSRPSALVSAGGALFFSSDDGVHGKELWRSDGTGAGTVLVKDVWPGFSGSFATPAVVVGDTLIFGAADTAHGFELWRSDGTGAGTSLILDIEPGTRGSFPSTFVAAGDDAFFTAEFGTELWRTDGTTGGTELVRAFPSSQGSRILSAFWSGAELYFSANDEPTGHELWVSDGTEVGTRLLKDIEAGPRSSTPTSMAKLGDSVYFTAFDLAHGRELWRSDGTNVGTELVANIHLGSEGSFPFGFTPLDEDTVVFEAFDDVSGSEMWRTDGTRAGTALIKDVPNPSGKKAIPFAGPFDFLPLDGRVFFRKLDDVHGMELWVTDGTEAGTFLVRDILPGDGSSSPASPAARSGLLLFTAKGVEGFELWRSDGTVAGTTLVKDIFPGTGSSGSANSSVPAELVPVGDRVLFRANGPNHGAELWTTDGTQAGTALVSDIFVGPNGSFPTGLTVVGPRVFFQARDELHGQELWVSDGTDLGTSLVMDIHPTASSSARPAAVIDSKLYFTANDGIHGTELWTTDGTPGTTRLVKDIRPGSVSSMSSKAGNDVAVLNGVLFFVANDGQTGTELWRSDGTEGGTSIVKDIFPGIGGSKKGTIAAPFFLTALDETLFFFANDDVHGAELWTSDGTASGTRLAVDFLPGTDASLTPLSPNVDDVAAVRGRLFLGVDAGFLGSELWGIRVTSEQRVEDLLDAVRTTDLPHGTIKSLSAKLENALASLAGGNDNAAAGKLGAFIAQVEAQRGKTIPTEIADSWIREANAISSTIE